MEWFHQLNQHNPFLLLQLLDVIRMSLLWRWKRQVCFEYFCSCYAGIEVNHSIHQHPHKLQNLVFQQEQNDSIVTALLLQLFFIIPKITPVVYCCLMMGNSLRSSNVPATRLHAGSRGHNQQLKAGYGYRTSMRKYCASTGCFLNQSPPK